MTQDDIIRMAREAGSLHEGALFVPDAFVLRFAALVAAAEREACCQLVWNTRENDDIYVSLRETLAIAIKARGKK